MAQITHGIPVIGFEVGAGQFEAFDEDGVATGPIVGLTLIERDGDRHEFTLHPDGGHILADSLHAASTTSLQLYYPKQTQARMKSHRRAMLLGAAVMVLVCSFSGWADSLPASGHGSSVVLGVLGGIEELLMTIGILTMIMLGAQLRHRRRSKKTTAVEQDR